MTECKYFLIPVNLLLLYATFKYPRYAHAKRLLGGRKISLRNLFITSTVQALFFTTTLVVTNCAILGLNPLGMYGRYRSQWHEQDITLGEMIVSDTEVIPGLPEGTKYADLPEDLQELMYD